MVLGIPVSRYTGIPLLFISKNRAKHLTPASDHDAFSLFWYAYSVRSIG